MVFILEIKVKEKVISCLLLTKMFILEITAKVIVTSFLVGLTKLKIKALFIKDKNQRSQIRVVFIEDKNQRIQIGVV
jgi:hypothetical protein